MSHLRYQLHIFFIYKSGNYKALKLYGCRQLSHGDTQVLPVELLPAKIISALACIIFSAQHHRGILSPHTL